EILRHLPFVSRLGAITKYTAPLRGWLPGKRFDLALVFGFDRELVAYALRASDKVVAFRQKDSAQNARLFLAVDEPAPQSRHAVGMRTALIEPLRIPSTGQFLSYVVTPEETAWARRTLAGLPKRAGPLVGLQIASFPTKDYRDWPAEQFEALCRRILERW